MMRYNGADENLKTRKKGQKELLDQEWKRELLNVVA